MRTLKECVLTDPNKGQSHWENLEKKATEQLYFQRFIAEMKKKLVETEGTLQGAVDTETDATNALGVVYNQIIMGVEEHHPLDYARIFNTDKMQLLVPIGTYGKAKQRNANGSFSAGEKTQSPVTITLDTEHGVDVSWTKAHLDDAAWDVLSEQNQGAGYAIQLLLSTKLCAEVKAITAAQSAGGAFVTMTATTSMLWAEFLNLLAAVDIGGTGPADYVLCTPARYWQLLALDQFVNSLYAGSDEVMRTGIAKTMMGVTVVRCHALADPTTMAYADVAGGIDEFTVGYWLKGAAGAIGRIASLRKDVAGASGFVTFDDDITGVFVDEEIITEYKDAACTIASGVTGTVEAVIGVSGASIVALNSKKALALVYRRNIEIEPFEYPDQNRYGFIASVRAKAGTLVPSAVAISTQ